MSFRGKDLLTNLPAHLPKAAENELLVRGWTLFTSGLGWEIAIEVKIHLIYFYYYLHQTL